MNFNLVGTILVLSKLVLAKESTVSVSGGGILPSGSSFNLTLDNQGEVWDRCYFFFDKNPCTFDLDEDAEKDTVVAKMRKCGSEELKKAIEFTGTDKTKCQVTITDEEDKFKGKWSARFDDDMSAIDFEVILAEPIEKHTITSENSKIGIPADSENGEIKCTFFGGAPNPKIDLLLENEKLTEEDSPFLVNSTETGKENGEDRSVSKTFTIHPTVEDNRKKVSCQAQQVDGDGKNLFDLVETDEITLNVTFAPVLVDNISMSGKLGEDSEFEVKFKSNPDPINVLWIISSMKSMDHSEDSLASDSEQQEEISVYPGNSDDGRYVLSKLTQDEEGVYHTKMTLKNLEEKDSLLEYRFEVTNSLGELSKQFKVTLQDEENVSNNSTTTEATNSNNNGTDDTGVSKGPSKGAKIAFGIMALVIFVALILCCVYVYRANYQNRATAPLSSQESR